MNVITDCGKITEPLVAVPLSRTQCFNALEVVCEIQPLGSQNPTFWAFERFGLKPQSHWRVKGSVIGQ